MTKKVASFSPGKIESAAPVEGPHIFLNMALLRVNPALNLVINPLVALYEKTEVTAVVNSPF